MPPLRQPSLVQIAVETFEEGCMGETLAVCRAAAQLRDATEPEARRVLQGIVDDESRHAALAWDIVAWALTQGGAEVRAALSAAVERARLPAAGTLGTMHTAAHGLPASVQDALEVGFYEVIRPTVCELLAA